MLSEELRTALRDVAERAAEAARLPLAAHLASGRRAVVERKGEGDFVTELDRHLEATIDGFLRNERPEDGFIGEESGARDLGADIIWVVDPIDGTSNFMTGLDHYAIAVACLHAGRPVAAAAITWPGEKLFSAAAGMGATLDGRPLRTPVSPKEPDELVLGVQWFRDRGDASWDFLARVADLGVRIRVLGSTVVQMCAVTTGQLDGNIQEQGKLWDIAAAALIASESGAQVSDWRGEDPFPIDAASARIASGKHHFPAVTAPAPVHALVLERLRQLG